MNVAELKTYLEAQDFSEQIFYDFICRNRLCGRTIGSASGSIIRKKTTPPLQTNWQFMRYQFPIYLKDCEQFKLVAYRESQNGRGKGISKSLFFSSSLFWLLFSMHTNASPRLNNLFHLCLLSFRLTAPGKWKTRTNDHLRFFHQIGI